MIDDCAWRGGVGRVRVDVDGRDDCGCAREARAGGSSCLGRRYGGKRYGDLAGKISRERSSRIGVSAFTSFDVTMTNE